MLADRFSAGSPPARATSLSPIFHTTRCGSRAMAFATAAISLWPAAAKGLSRASESHDMQLPFCDPSRWYSLVVMTDADTPSSDA